MKLVSATDLTKTYSSEVTAVDRISFDVNEGEIVGLLGPNGAGKTTTVRMLTTLTRPTSGKAVVGGFDVVKDAKEVRKIVGIVRQDLSVDDDLTGVDNLLLQSRLYHIPMGEARERAEELFKLVDLTEAAHRDVETYSGGMRKRLEIICGLVGHPRILFLDEPTLGLDLQSRMNVWNYLRKLNAEGQLTLFVTTHYMEEADSLCSRVIIMNHGRVAASGTPDSLKATLGERLTQLTVECPNPAAVGILKSLDSLVAFDRIDEFSYRTRLKCSEDSLQDIIKRLTAERIRIIGLDYPRPSLDEVFLHYTGTKLKEEIPDEETVQRFFRYWRTRRE